MTTKLRCFSASLVSSRCFNSVKYSGKVPEKNMKYHSEKIKEDRLPRDFGYTERLLQGGLLPRLENAKPLKEMPTFRPKDKWAEKRALFGQNDYIDILGTGNVRPIDVLYGVPYWLRGLKDNREYQMLLRKRIVYGQRGYAARYPTKWENMQKRIEYLYRYTNNYQPQKSGWKGQ